jgi:hypothetical protein
MKLFFTIILVSGVCCLSSVKAQDDKKQLMNLSMIKDSSKTDSLKNNASLKPSSSPITKDSILKPKHTPRGATLRSAVLPGWGQAYNKDYWKIPVVYAVLAIPTFTFFYNNTYYKRTDFAYNAVYEDQNNGNSSLLPDIHPSVLKADGTPLSLTAYSNYRIEFRKDRELSALWFLIVWGLNVVDATVSAHLKDFDVSNDLSMNIKPNFNPATKTPEISIALNFRNSSSKHKIVR